MHQAGIGNIAWAALVLMGFALAMSRRSLHLSVILCFLALAFLGLGAIQWWKL
jgi:hypothetical protein